MYLRDLVDHYSQDLILNQQNYLHDIPSVRDKIETARPKIFNFDYPFFDEAKRKEFETHFIRKFYMSEIGFETEYLWQFNLENWLVINMPYWNKMFESELIEFDPIENVSVHTVADKTNNQKIVDKTTDNQSLTNETIGNAQTNQDYQDNAQSDTNGTSTSDDTSFDRALKSDTPDSRLAITTNDGAGVIQYASEIKENTHTGSNNERTTGHGESSADGLSHSNQDTKVNTDQAVDRSVDYGRDKDDTENKTEWKHGKQGDKTYSEMLTEYRDTFLRIEKLIFDEMKILFMALY